MTTAHDDDPPFPIALADICECLPLPRLYWHTPDTGWEDQGDVSQEGDVDAYRYNAGPYDAWVVSCPDCHLVYARGDRR